MSGRIAAILSILILLPVLVGPIIVGFLLEDEITSQIGRPGTGIVLEYERGLYTSTARTTLTMGPDSGALAGSEVVLDHLIIHGPVPLAAPVIGRSPIDLAVFVVRSRFDADPEAIPNVARALDGAAIATVDTHVGLDRSVEAELEAPPFELEGGTFEWKGMSGEMAGSSEAGTADGVIELHGLEAFDGVTSFTVAPGTARFSVDGDRARLVATLDQEGMELVSEDGRLALGTFHAEGESAVSGDPFRPTEGKGTLTEISGGGGLGDTGFLISDLEFTQKSTIDDASGLYRGEMSFGFTSGQTGARPADGPGGFKVVLDRIDPEAAVRFRNALQTLEASGGSPEEVAAMRPFIVLEQLPGLLASSPSFDLKDLSFDAPEGRLAGAFHLSVDGSQPEMLQDPFSLMGQLEMSANMDAPEALLRRLLAPLANAAAEDAPEVAEGEMPDGEAADTLLHPVDAWLANGTLVREGDRLRMDARFENGFPMLNGKPADPALMMKLMPGM